VLANQKGGVGKSAVATQLAYYLHKRGKRILLIDLDHQCNTSNAVRLSGLAFVAQHSSTQLLGADVPAPPESAFVLVAGDDALSSLERQPEQHNAFANRLDAYLRVHDTAFDYCLLDTNPNPDIRYAASLIVAQFMLSPIQLNQEALDGVAGLLRHPRYGFHKIKAALNPRLDLIGLLPNLVEATPFQKANLKQLVEAHQDLLIPLDRKKGTFAYLAKRTAVAEAQAAGVPMFDLKKSSARDAWLEVKPVFDVILKHMEGGHA
jgi:chromosome partitioning protein